MAISALPPFNGFFSEWLTFQSLFLGIAGLHFWAKWVFVASAGALAFTGGLALACFVKAFGATFLARPRSAEVGSAKETGAPLQIGMAALALLCLVFGLYSGTASSILGNIARGLAPFHNAPSVISTSAYQGLSVAGFSFVSAPILGGLFLLAFLLVWLFARRFVNPKQQVRVSPTWDCGTDLTSRMEITSTGFARSIITIFKGILKPSIQHETEYHDSESRYLPKSRKIVLSIKDLYGSYLYEPLNLLVAKASARARTIQSGNINAYILYIFVALLVALTFVK
jgi:hydrogenase-4 component B